MNAQLEFYQQKLNYEIDPSDLFSALENGEKIIPLDTRKAMGYASEHIPGAMNIPHRDMNETTTAQLDRSALYVCYCDGIGCNASTKGSLNMTRLGFNVKELIGGLEWWKMEGYATEGAKSTSGQLIQCAC
jgi:rhodanese-related sulfurtransferase